MIKSGAGPAVNHPEGLVLIQIDQSEATRQTTMSTWALPLGDDLYQIRRPLSMMSGFDVGDVVKAVVRSGETSPTVVEIVRKGDSKTLHLSFVKGVPVVDQQKLLNELGKWNAVYEMSFERFYTVVVAQSDYDELCEYLKSVPRDLVRYEPEVEIDRLITDHLLEC